MAEVAPFKPDVPFPEIRDAFTQKRTWVVAQIGVFELWLPRLPDNCSGRTDGWGCLSPA